MRACVWKGGADVLFNPSGFIESNLPNKHITLFCEFFQVPRVGLLQVGRLGQRLNISTQGQRVTHTGDSCQGQIPNPGNEAGRIGERLTHYQSAN